VDVVFWGLRLEPGPTPAVAPKLVSWKSADVVFHHDEPASEGASTAYGSSCHVFSARIEDFLYENCAVGKVSVLSIRGDGSGRCIDQVQLLRAWTVVFSHCPAAQNLIRGSIVGRNVQISRVVDNRRCRSLVLSARIKSVGSDGADHKQSC